MHFEPYQSRYPEYSIKHCAAFLQSSDHYRQRNSCTLFHSANFGILKKSASLIQWVMLVKNIKRDRGVRLRQEFCRRSYLSRLLTKIDLTLKLLLRQFIRDSLKDCRAVLIGEKGVVVATLEWTFGQSPKMIYGRTVWWQLRQLFTKWWPICATFV